MSAASKSRRSANITTHEHSAPFDGALKSAPELTRAWGPFLAFVIALTGLGLYGVSMARTNTDAIVVGFLVAFALLVALIARLKRVN